MAKLSTVEGIGLSYAQKLQDAGVSTTQDLLQQGKTPEGRQEIAEKVGVKSQVILTWVNHVDLFRVRGVSEEYADLLEEAGVDTVPELAQRNPANLHQKLVEVNQVKNLVRRVPGENQISDWIKQAKALPRVVSY
jgi:predicted flap endonuclease-1-like 5' DNA nuclease